VGVIDADGWTWPTAGGVASGFGQRLHPILGYYRMHSGLDIGGAQGQPIWAANEGIVIMAGWNGGYGNTVVIQHGDSSVTTLYAHMSGFATSVGDYVTSGQVIGYVGSTGLSTGPHLHFEVRINGSAVDPMPYLP
jgi:murein DD-endopeptidase MepM/ murein hydrolase activator NlpD